jgi:hypothetical protein
LYIGDFIGNKYTDEFIVGQNAQKNYILHSINIFIDKFNISLTEKSYIMSSVFLFIHQYINH